MRGVGSKLRELRARRGLGLRELAVRSGVSHSAISLIERGRMSPSVDTLAAVLDAMGSTPAAFFSEIAAATPPAPFYAAADLAEIGRPGRVSQRVVGLNHPNRRLMLLHETFAPGAQAEAVAGHIAEEAGVVTRGAIALTVAGETRVLCQGDAYYFDSRLPHQFRNADAGESEIVSAVTPPTY